VDCQSSQCFSSDYHQKLPLINVEQEAMTQKVHIGICGAGIGGLAAAISMAKAGAKVTVLEAAPELGEIGAGIQMTPNVARLLVDWGVDQVIRDNLVEFEELNMRKRDGAPVGYTRMVPDVRRNLGYPWWLVHRMHLHEGLAKVAKKQGQVSSSTLELLILIGRPRRELRS